MSAGRSSMQHHPQQPPMDFEENLHLARSSGAVIINKLEGQALQLEQARTTHSRVLGSMYPPQSLPFLAGNPHSGAAAVEVALRQGAVGAARLRRAELSELAQTSSGADRAAEILDRVTDDDGRAGCRLRRGGATATHLRAGRDAASAGRALRRTRRPSLAQPVRQCLSYYGQRAPQTPHVTTHVTPHAQPPSSVTSPLCYDRLAQLYGDATWLVERGCNTGSEVPRKCPGPSDAPQRPWMPGGLRATPLATKAHDCVILRNPGLTASRRSRRLVRSSHPLEAREGHGPRPHPPLSEPRPTCTFAARI